MAELRKIWNLDLHVTISDAVSTVKYDFFLACSNDSFKNTSDCNYNLRAIIFLCSFLDGHPPPTDGTDPWLSPEQPKKKKKKHLRPFLSKLRI